MTQKSLPPECALDLNDDLARPSPSTSPTLTDRAAFGRPEQSKSACSGCLLGSSKCSQFRAGSNFITQKSLPPECAASI